jgi:lauroyl/myristoyl acyltransferase
VNLQHFLVTGAGTRLAMRLSAMVPRRLGYSAIRGVTFFIAHRDSELTRAVRSNLSVVLGTTAHDPQLDRLVHEVLFQSASGTYDFFRALGSTAEEIRELIDMPQAIWDVLDPAGRSGRGVVIVAPHVSTQDLGGLGFGAQPGSKAYEVQVLSYALPPSGYELMNDLRSTEGLILTPSSGDALRQAAKRLRSGGVVFTSLDRPPPKGRRAQTATFFGKPARLWNGFAKLAVSTGALLQVIWVERTPDARYRLHVGRQIDPLHLPGTDITEALWRAALDEAETIIRRHPEQWLMFFRVWPGEGT